MSLHVFLYVLAIVLFIIAALPTSINVKCEWLAFAALVTAQVI